MSGVGFNKVTIIDSINASILRKHGHDYCLELGNCEIGLPMNLSDEEFLIGQAVKIMSIESDSGVRMLRIEKREPVTSERKEALLRDIEAFLNE